MTFFRSKQVNKYVQIREIKIVQSVNHLLNNKEIIGPSSSEIGGRKYPTIEVIVK